MILPKRVCAGKKRLIIKRMKPDKRPKRKLRTLSQEFVEKLWISWCQLDYWKN